MKTISLLILPATVGIIAMSIMSPRPAIGGASAQVKTSVALDAAKIDPKKALTALETDIDEIMSENAKQAFSITASDSKKVAAVLSGLKKDITDLRKKYASSSGEVEAAAFYKEVEAAFDANEADGKKLILSLTKKGEITAQGHECENFCWESCGHNSVGEWVCFITCRRHCT
jgi:hypothetical protein